MACRTIVIGDIHGCFDELNDLIEKLDLQNDDRVIAVGDLIAKGPRSRDVLELFIQDSRFSSVIGNFDRALRQHWRGEPMRLKSYLKVTAAELQVGWERYYNYFRSLPYYIDLGSHLIVHAGIRPGVPLDEQMASDLTEIRTMGADPTRRKGVAWYKIYRGPKTILFGHWPKKKPKRAPFAIGLDTGCVYGGHLTGYILESDEFVSVPARDTYDGRRKEKKRRKEQESR
jgi:hypothetical protein